MAVDKNKILDNASKYLQKGQIDKAIKEYSTLLQVDPKNIAIRLKRADLYARQGQKREALEDFIKSGEDYTKGGFYSKAVAVFKQALQVDNRQLILYLRLGELYHKLGLAGEAMQQYRFVASYYDREGKVKECLEILRKMVELDPENLASRVKLGELYYRQGMKKEAQEEFAVVAEALKGEGRTDDLITLYERVLTLNPMNLQAVKELGQVYLTKGEPQKALAKLQLPLKEGTRDKDILELLARIYYSMKREDKAKNALKEIARICREEGDDDAARGYYKKVLQLDPRDQDAGQFLGAPAAQESVIELSEAVEPPPRPAPKHEPKAAKPAAKAAETPRSKPAAKGPESPVSKFFVEAEVYLKYGLKEKAIEQINKVLEKEPKNQQALRKLVELFTSTKNRARAVAPLLTLADISMEKDSKEQAEKYLTEAIGYDPANKEVKSRLNALKGVEEETAEEEEVEEVEAVEEVPEVEEEKEPETVEEEEEEVAKVKKAPRRETIEIEGFAEEKEEEPFDIAEEPKKKTAAKSRAEVREEEEGSFEGIVEEEEKAESEDAAEELDEAEFYVQQGLHDEARKIYDRILAKSPGDPTVTARLKELEKLEKKAPPPKREPIVEEEEPRFEMPRAARPPVEEARGAPERLVARPTPSLIDENGEEGHFDLAKELSEELDFTGAAEESPVQEASQQVSVEEVLSAFKQGVEKTIGKEDGQAHYDLGIAYKEMGLSDEAIREFETASATPAREIDSLSMLGLCSMEKGDHGKAIQYYLRAVASPRASDKEKVALYYDLAKAHETGGDLPQAMRYFALVCDTDPQFRDAVARIKALKDKGVATAQEEAAQPSALPRTGAPTAPAKEAPVEESKVIPFAPPRKRVSYV